MPECEHLDWEPLDGDRISCTSCGRLADLFVAEPTPECKHTGCMLQPAIDEVSRLRSALYTIHVYLNLREDQTHEHFGDPCGADACILCLADATAVAALVGSYETSTGANDHCTCADPRLLPQRDCPAHRFRAREWERRTPDGVTRALSERPDREAMPNISAGAEQEHNPGIGGTDAA